MSSQEVIENTIKEIKLLQSFFEDCQEVVLHKNDIRFHPDTIEVLNQYHQSLKEYEELKKRVKRFEIYDVIANNQQGMNGEQINKIAVALVSYLTTKKG